MNQTHLYLLKCLSFFEKHPFDANPIDQLVYYYVWLNRYPYPFYHPFTPHTFCVADQLILVDCVRENVPNIGIFLIELIKLRCSSLSEDFINGVLKCAEDGVEASYEVLTTYIIHRISRHYYLSYDDPEQDKVDMEFRAKALNALVKGLENGSIEAGRCLNVYVFRCYNDTLLYTNGIMDRVVACFGKNSQESKSEDRTPRNFSIILDLLKKYRDPCDWKAENIRNGGEFCWISNPDEECTAFFKKHQKTFYSFYKKGIPYADRLFQKFCKFFLYNEKETLFTFY